jgi:hypothetical protein
MKGRDGEGTNQFTFQKVNLAHNELLVTSTLPDHFGPATLSISSRPCFEGGN